MYSLNLPKGELFIAKPLLDERHRNNNFFAPNRALSARRLIVERKMTPMVSGRRGRRRRQSQPARAPYQAPPQTASGAFFMWTSKRAPVIKIAPASRLPGSAHCRRMGCGNRPH